MTFRLFDKKCINADGQLVDSNNIFCEALYNLELTTTATENIKNTVLVVSTNHISLHSTSTSKAISVVLALLVLCKFAHV